MAIKLKNHRHGLNPTAILLGRVFLWRFTSTSHSLRLDGFGMYAICLVSLYHPSKVFQALKVPARQQARQIGSLFSQEYRMRDFKSSTDGSPTPFSFFLLCIHSRSLYTTSTGIRWRLILPQVSCSTGPVSWHWYSKHGSHLPLTAPSGT